MWSQYEALTQKEAEVAELATHKKSVKLHLWVRKHSPWGGCDTALPTSGSIKAEIDRQNEAQEKINDLEF